MKITFFAAAAALFASAASAREFHVYSDVNFKGKATTEARHDKTCWNIGAHGRTARSIGNDNNEVTCTAFYNQPDCKGGQWIQTTSAGTIPSFLETNIWSFRNMGKEDPACREELSKARPTLIFG
ncbi:hypothetical protein M011DRAFT_467583 [Sporormia fimetaria CBS 119925]|uniref:Uncharacterized protein n=1 Tax=Sporormia fimetaria CBS 119925 TaxID=1340428 RepID=A0A6A6VCS7_9PLEO|nr:hypothetical protein M011DRAFT_467583 [Sporormia fimetaria CBS 119925]